MADRSHHSAATPSGVPRPAAGFSAPFGVPLGDFGLLGTLIVVIALTLAAFFLATFVAIVSLLATAAATHHTVDYALSYRRVGVPAACVVFVLAFAYFGTLWVRRITRRA